MHCLPPSVPFFALRQFSNLPLLGGTLSVLVPKRCSAFLPTGHRSCSSLALLPRAARLLSCPWAFLAHQAP